MVPRRVTPGPDRIDWGHALSTPAALVSSALHGVMIGLCLILAPVGWAPPHARLARFSFDRAPLACDLDGEPAEPPRPRQEPAVLDDWSPAVPDLVEPPPPIVDPDPFPEREPLAAWQPPRPVPDTVWSERVRRMPDVAAEPTPVAGENEPPRYPRRAIRAHLQGRVVLEVVVDRAGLVVRCEVVVSSGHAILDRAAQRAVQKWDFSHGPGVVRIPVDFVLAQDE